MENNGKQWKTIENNRNTSQSSKIMRKSTKDQQLPMELVIFSLQINSKISRGPWLQAFVRTSTIWSSWHSNIYTVREKEIRNSVNLQPDLFDKIKCPNSLMHETRFCCTCPQDSRTTHRFLRTCFWEKSESSLTLTRCEADIKLWKHPRCIAVDSLHHCRKLFSPAACCFEPQQRKSTGRRVLPSDQLCARRNYELTYTYFYLQSTYKQKSQWLITSKLYCFQLNLSSRNMRSTVVVRPLEIPAASCQVEILQ